MIEARAQRNHSRVDGDDAVPGGTAAGRDAAASVAARGVGGRNHLHRTAALCRTCVRYRALRCVRTRRIRRRLRRRCADALCGDVRGEDRPLDCSVVALREANHHVALPVEPAANDARRSRRHREVDDDEWSADAIARRSLRSHVTTRAMRTVPLAGTGSESERLHLILRTKSDVLLLRATRRRLAAELTNDDAVVRVTIVTGTAARYTIVIPSESGVCADGETIIARPEQRCCARARTHPPSWHRSRAPSPYRSIRTSPRGAWTMRPAFSRSKRAPQTGG